MRNIIEAIKEFFNRLFKGTEETVDDIMSNFITVRDKLDQKAAKEENNAKTLQNLANELTLESNNAKKEQAKAIRLRKSLDKLLVG